jgi:hypothetical protein
MVARIRSYFTKVAQMLSGILAVIGALALYKGCVPIIDGWLWLGGFCFVLPLIPSLRDVSDGFVREDDLPSNGN